MTVEIIMMAAGLLTHFFKSLQGMKREGRPITPKEYWRDNPYHSGLSIVGAVIGFILLNETGQLNLAAAFTVGFMADSMPNMIGSRTTIDIGKK